MTQPVADAVKRVAAGQAELDARISDLVACVRAAHAGGTPIAELARLTGRHRNTVAAWCRTRS